MIISGMMELRPHHILDILSAYGKDIVYQPHPYGHSLHLVAAEIFSDPGRRIKLVLGADAVCIGCVHLMQNGRCDDVLHQLNPSPSKQAYNDVLDSRLIDLFGLTVNAEMTVHEYLEMVNAKVPGIEEICTHPREDKKERRKGLISGLIKLGIRADQSSTRLRS